MTKVAVFVEGQSELIFVRELLLKHFDYQGISLKCLNFLNDSNLTPAEYDFPNPSAALHFQIMNVGMDGAVLSRLLKREQRLWEEGFMRIIGLRDMYSEHYRKLVKDRSIDPAKNEEFIAGHQTQINQSAKRPETIFFHFAIMELEAWLLGLNSVIERIVKPSAANDFYAKLGYDLATTDPEHSFFHPFVEIARVLALGGSIYGKSAGDVNAFMGHVTREDLNTLRSSGKCASFASFCKSLLEFQ